MSKILTLTEMLEACRNIKHREPAAILAESMLLNVADSLAGILADFYKMDCSAATASTENEGGIAVSFTPRYEGQQWPKSLEMYDTLGDFD